MENSNNRKQDVPGATPGNVFVTYEKRGLGDYVPIGAEVRDITTSFNHYLDQKVNENINKNKIPDLYFACYPYEDIRGKSADMTTDALIKGSIEPHQRLHGLVDVAFCIENGRNDYLDPITPLVLNFDPHCCLYRTVNDMGYREYYAGLNEQTKELLLQKLNRGNPTLNMKELPIISSLYKNENLTQGKPITHGLLLVETDWQGKPLGSLKTEPVSPDYFKDYAGMIFNAHKSAKIIPDTTIQAYYFDNIEDIPQIKQGDQKDYQERVMPQIREKSYSQESINLRDYAYCMENGIEPFSRHATAGELSKHREYDYWNAINNRGERLNFNKVTPDEKIMLLRNLNLKPEKPQMLRLPLIGETFDHRKAIMHGVDPDSDRARSYRAIETDKGYLLFSNTHHGYAKMKECMQYISDNFYDPQNHVSYVRVHEVETKVPSDWGKIDKGKPDYIDNNVKSNLEKLGGYKVIQTSQKHDMSPDPEHLRNFNVRNETESTQRQTNIYQLHTIAKTGDPAGMLSDANTFRYAHDFKPLQNQLDSVNDKKSEESNKQRTEIQNQAKALATKILRRDYPQESALINSSQKFKKNQIEKPKIQAPNTKEKSKKRRVQ